MNIHFPKKDVQMASRYMKRCMASLVIGKTQIKTAMRFHLTPVKMALIKKRSNDKCWKGCGEKVTPVTYC